jgi:hypothetical protein
MDTGNFKPGQTIVYDDGRPGHRGVSATILSVSKTTMVVQFEDRADTTTIHFSDRDWVDHIQVKLETN